MRLVQNGSNEGRLEASHVINEKYQAVDDKMKQLQNAFLQKYKALRPDLLDENDGEAAAGAAEAGPPPTPPGVKQLQNVFLKAQSSDTAEGNDCKAGAGAAEQDWVDAAEASVTGAGAEASVSGV